MINGTKYVIVKGELRRHEPMAWDFVVNFAKDNDLVVTEVCLLPEARAVRRTERPAEAAEPALQPG